MVEMPGIITIHKIQKVLGNLSISSSKTANRYCKQLPCKLCQDDPVIFQKDIWGKKTNILKFIYFNDTIQ